MDKHLVEWNGRRGFTGTTPDGRRSRFDVRPVAGGDGEAPSPMDTVLHALAACTAIDVAMILEKMRLKLEDLRIEIAGEQAEKNPRVFTRIEMTIIARGDIPEAKLKRAVDLSTDTYCSVGAMIGRTAEIRREIRIEH